MNFLLQMVHLHPKGVMSKREMASAPVMHWTWLLGLVEACLGKGFIWLLIIPFDVARAPVMLWVLLFGSADARVGACFVGILVLPVHATLDEPVAELAKGAGTSDERLLGNRPIAQLWEGQVVDAVNMFC